MCVLYAQRPLWCREWLERAPTILDRLRPDRCSTVDYWDIRLICVVNKFGGGYVTGVDVVVPWTRETR